MPSRARAAEDVGLLLFESGQTADREFIDDGSHEISLRANILLQSSSKPPVLGMTKAMQVRGGGRCHVDKSPWSMMRMIGRDDNSMEDEVAAGSSSALLKTISIAH